MIKHIFITGGHITPALAVIDELHEHYGSKVKITVVGRKLVEGAESFEYQEVRKRSVPFIHLSAGRMTRLLDINSFRQLLTIPAGLLSAFRIIKKEKPDCILTFGGYIGFPIALVGFLLGIPVYSHEQTIAPGIANRIIGLFSRKVFVAFEEARTFFSPKKTMVTGNPLRKSITSPMKSSLNPITRPVIYITGGSLGSHSINMLIQPILIQLIKRAMVIHQTGNAKEFHDYEHFLNLKHELPGNLQTRYVVRPHILDNEIGNIYGEADLVISRSGANTFFELIHLCKPAVLIPLPWSANGEQLKHAQMFAARGFGEMFEQSGNSEELLRLIEKMLGSLDHYHNSFIRYQSTFPSHAATIIVSTIVENK